MPPPTFRQDTCTSRSWHSKRSWNWPGKWSPQGKVMVWNITTITPHTPTQVVGIPTRVIPTVTGGHTGSWHWIEVIFDGWIYWRHRRHHHWWPNLGGARQKRSIIFNPHHIQATAVLRTAEMGRPPFSSQTIRRGSSRIMQDMSVLGHPNFLSTGIPPQRKMNNLGTGNKGIPILNKNEYRQSGIPEWQAQPRHTYHLPSTLLPD